MGSFDNNQTTESQNTDQTALPLNQLSPECSKKILEVANQMSRVLIGNPNGVQENPQQSGREIAEGSAAALPSMVSCVVNELKASRLSRS